MNRLLSFFVLYLLFVMMPRAEAQEAERPLVVATTTIIADVTRNIAGDRADVVALMPPVVSPVPRASRRGVPKK